jgi:hypothetical protein
MREADHREVRDSARDEEQVDREHRAHDGSTGKVEPPSDAAVFHSLPALCERLHETPLRGPD